MNQVQHVDLHVLVNYSYEKIFDQDCWAALKTVEKASTTTLAIGTESWVSVQLINLGFRLLINSTNLHAEQPRVTFCLSTTIFVKSVQYIQMI